jgi:hypothetical protein
MSPKLNAYDLVLVQEDFVFHDELARDARHPFQSLPLVGYATFVGDGLDTFSSVPFGPLRRVKWSRWHGLFGDNFDGLASKGFTFAVHLHRLLAAEDSAEVADEDEERRVLLRDLGERKILAV